MKQLVIALVRIYQYGVSPALHTLLPVRGGCRYPVSCSVFMIQRVRADGAWKGLVSGITRFSRCHPFRSQVL